jgi:hypothetical protein
MKLKANENSKNLTNWLYKNLQNDVFFELINFDLQESESFYFLDSINFSSKQR